jgi:hypothetical protein
MEVARLDDKTKRQVSCQLACTIHIVHTKHWTNRLSVFCLVPCSNGHTNVSYIFQYGMGCILDPENIKRS